MAITISGENNNDRILASDGVIDQLSGINIAGIVTATSFTGDLTGNVTGNLTGNVNSTSPLLLQTGGSERFRITGNNELGIAGANYGTSGQVLTSGGSGSAVSWVTPAVTAFTNGSNNRVVTATSGSGLNGEANLNFDGTGLGLVGHIDIRTGSSINTNVTGGGASGTLHKNTTSGEFAIVSGGTGGNNYLTFYTSANAAPTEKLRITHEGKTTIKSTLNGEIFRIETSAGNPGGTQGLAYMGFDHFPASTKPAILIGSEEEGVASYKGSFVVKLKDAAATDDDPVQRFKIDSSGRVMIGRASAYGSADADNLIVGDEAVNEHQGITILSHSGKYGGIYFGDGAGSNPAERGKIIYDHPNDQLRMGTAGSAATKFYINSTGQVGVNVSPSMFLQVNNNLTGTSETDKRIAGFYKTFASSSSDREGYIHLSSYVGHYGVKLGYYNEGVNPGVLQSGFFVSTSGTSEQLTNHIKRFVIKSGGNIGIGQENPTVKLQVTDTSAVHIRAEATANDGDAMIQALGKDSSGNDRMIQMRTDAGADQYRIISSDTTYNLALCTGNAPRVLIAGNSAATSIGGSNVFNAMLTVQGDISGQLFTLKATENTNRLMVSGNNDNDVEMNFYDKSGGQKGILVGGESEFSIKAPSSSAPLRIYSHNGSSLTEKLSIGLGTKDLVRTHRGFLIGKNRSKFSSDHGENKPSTPYYTGQGEKVFGIDPSWSNEELQKYFRSDNVQWYSDDTAPGGYAIQIDGNVNVGGDYRSGFPYIPIDDDDQFFQEMWIRTHDGSQNHYAGSIQYDKDFAYGTGWPGSYGYELMSNTTINSTSWTRKTATLGPNHSSSYQMGAFRSNASGYGGRRKYWTPQALFNYINNSGTRRCYISGWAVYRRRSRGNTYFASISKGSGSFQIKHPLEAKKDTHYLRHSFIEGPKCDNIYRGKATLSSGTTTVNLDTEGTMTEGTFVALNDNVQCYTTNETGWSAVKGSVSGNILTITAQDNTSTDTISWMVVGERKDDEIKASDLTDGNGKLLVEPQVDQQYVGLSTAPMVAPGMES